MDSKPVASDAILIASFFAIPALDASWMTADGSYTAPAHKPIMAMVKRMHATHVRRR